MDPRLRTNLIRVWFYGPWVLGIVAASVTAIVLHKPKYLILALPCVGVLYAIRRTEHLDPINDQTVRGLAPCYKPNFSSLMVVLASGWVATIYKSPVLAFFICTAAYALMGFSFAGVFYVCVSHGRRKVHPYLERLLEEQRARNA